ncbi:HET-domain-containing protein [Hyaloscypha bicolor E]|uniref:HET-domain-containing protein n=1 Tax=Hyaloscypha bicolor E TaxID=1095630 RepID=A0A2J6T3X9_9HELO|nr:HET-domain-containing protein [Hyaloscypha bicolor E]PMD57717.1 HET-domain-containing protein [Hyaloscypha bicolor E]
MKPYEYQPIDDPKGKIRILILLPPASSDDPELRCHLTTAEISDSPSYEALSYCWGTEALTERIHLPSGTLAITKNSATGLKRLRYRDRPRHLWVDAVCINQQDDQEKGHQVAFMAQIFRNAECVSVWLGEGNAEIHAGIETIRRLADSAWKYGLQSDRPFFYAEQLLGKLWDKNNGISAALLRLSWDIDFTSLNAFFAQAWFDRLWIVQEFVLASRVEILNCHDLLSYEEVLLAVALGFLLERHPTTQRLSATQFFKTVYLFNDREDFHRNKLEFDLLDGLWFHGRRLCTLDLDRVYGTLALVSKGPGLDLEIDYSISVETLYIRLALEYLKNGNLDILNYTSGYSKKTPAIGISPSSGYVPGPTLPSWVPDWRHERKGTSFLDTEPPFLAATKLSPKVYFENFNTYSVGFDGVCVDIVDISISLTEEIPLDSTLGFQRAVERVRLFGNAFSSRTTTNSYPMGEDPKLAFARCMLLDNRDTESLIRLGKTISPEAMLKMWEDWYECLVDNNAPSQSNMECSTVALKALREKHRAYTTSILNISTGRTYIITKSGYIGIGPGFAEAGDAICIFDGAQTPSILRKVSGNELVPDGLPATGQKDPDQDRERWKIIGECYLHGFMNNEVVDSEWQEKRRRFWLV